MIIKQIRFNKDSTKGYDWAKKKSIFLFTSHKSQQFINSTQRYDYTRSKKHPNIRLPHK